MQWMAILPACLLAAATAHGLGADVDPSERESVLAGRVRAVMGDMLHRLPDYTCVETIERSTRPPGSEKYKRLDRVRVEVAYYKGSELYAWPGAARFEEQSLTRLVGAGGAIGTGDFALHLMATYRGPVPLRFVGEEKLHGRAALKFTQVVPLELSTFKVGTPEMHLVGYEVTAWHDAQSLELLRFELLVTQFPPGVPLRRTFKAIEYQEVTVGESVFRLPVETELSMVHDNGVENRTSSRFANCRQYLGESTITYGDIEPGSVQSEARSRGNLPAGVKVPVKLTREMDLNEAARGDLVEMAVSQNVSSKGRTVLARGAMLAARVQGVFCGTTPFTYCYLLLKGETYENGTRSGPFSGWLEEPTLDEMMLQNQKVNRAVRKVVMPDEVIHTDQDVVVLFAAPVAKLPRGYPLVWRTLEVPGGPTP